MALGQYSTFSESEHLGELTISKQLLIVLSFIQLCNLSTNPIFFLITLKF